MAVSPELETLCQLARLPVPENLGDAAALAADVAGILGFFSAVQSVDTAGVLPLYHPGASAFPQSSARLREDIPADSLPLEMVLQNAPGTDGAFFLVPRVLS